MTPGPEQKRLEYFVGTWRFRLEMQESPFGPAGVVTGVDRNEMLPGGFFLLRRYETESPMGPIRGIEVIGYDPAAGAYLQRGFDSLGQFHTYVGRVEGPVWTFAYETAAGGKTWKVRITLTEASPRLQLYRCQISADGKSWAPTLDGRMEKVDGRALDTPGSDGSVL